MREGKNNNWKIVIISIVLVLLTLPVFVYLVGVNTKEENITFFDVEQLEDGTSIKVTINNGEKVMVVKQNEIGTRYEVGETHFAVVRKDTYWLNYYVDSSYKLWVVIGVEE